MGTVGTTTGGGVGETIGQCAIDQDSVTAVIPRAYEGPQPYLFICYAHEDAVAVYEDLYTFSQAGIRFWYDEGIPPASRWRESIASRVSASAATLYYISSSSVASQYCRQELLFAIDEDKPVLAVFLENVELSPGMRMTMREQQSVLRDGVDLAVYREKLLAGVQSLMVGGTTAPVVLDEASTRVLGVNLRLRIGSLATDVPPAFNGEFVVGRAADCHLVLPSDVVSRRHGYFRRVSQGYAYGDRSKNGTFLILEGVREVLIHREERRLPERGRLLLGDQPIDFEILAD